MRDCMNRRLDGKGVSLLQSPNKIRQHRKRENHQRMHQAVRKAMNRSLHGKAHPNMPDAAEDGCATCLNLARAAHPCNQNESNHRPKRLQPLTDGDESDSPTDKNRRTEIEGLACLKIKIREPRYSPCAERRIGSRQKDLPTRPQNEQGDEPCPASRRSGVRPNTAHG